MKKRILILLTAILTICSLSAQNDSVRHKPGVLAFGVDRDTLLYLIASPFDNWYLTVGGGVQTFIGNEIVNSARWNKVNYGVGLEIGKWIIPDLAVSMRFRYFGVDGQSKYGLQPYIKPGIDATNDNGYYPFHANAMTFTGLVTLDWTNFFYGYEVGKRERAHVYSPVGLGLSLLFGRQRNTSPRTIDAHPENSWRVNKELGFSLGLGFEYELTQEIALNLTADLYGSESTWDWSPYNNEKTIFDLMPGVYAGMRINIINEITKSNPYTGNLEVVTTYHEFRTVGSMHELERLKGNEKRLEQLDHIIDSLSQDNDSLRHALQSQYDSMKAVVDSLEGELAKQMPPLNVIEELISYNKLASLPSTIIYYDLDKYDIKDKDRMRLTNFASRVMTVLETHPDAQFYVIGAADSLTGTIPHNQKLSERRSKAAYDILSKALQRKLNAKTDEQGGRKEKSKDHLVTVAVGGITEYEPKEYNRMAFIIMKTPETEKIVERWLSHSSK